VHGTPAAWTHVASSPASANSSSWSPAWTSIGGRPARSFTPGIERRRQILRPADAHGAGRLALLRGENGFRLGKLHQDARAGLMERTPCVGEREAACRPLE